MSDCYWSSEIIGRIGNIEARQDQLEFKKLRKMLWHLIKLKKIIKEEIAEEKEVESRKLNVMCFNIPERKGSDIKERQNEDKDFLINLLDTKLNYSL